LRAKRTATPLPAQQAHMLRTVEDGAFLVEDEASGDEILIKFI